MAVSRLSDGRGGQRLLMLAVGCAASLAFSLPISAQSVGALASEQSGPGADVVSEQSRPGADVVSGRALASGSTGAADVASAGAVNTRSGRSIDPSSSRASLPSTAVRPAISIHGRLLDPGTQVEEIVAVVSGRPVLLGELDIEARLFRARTFGGGRLDGPVRREELAAALDRIIDALVVHAEAERLQVFEVPASELDRAFGDLRSTVGASTLDAFLRDFDLRDEELMELLRRELRVARYLEGRFRLASRPRDAEVQEAVRAAAEEGRTVSPDTVRATLSRERFLEMTRSFVEDLRRRSRIRIIRDPMVDEAGEGWWGTVSAAEVGEAESGARR